MHRATRFRSAHSTPASPPRPPREPQAAASRWIWGGLRALGCFFCIQLVLAYWGLRHVSARVTELGLDLESQLAAQMPELLEAPETVLVNGQRLFVSSTTTELSVEAALKRFADECVRRPPASPSAAVGNPSASAVHEPGLERSRRSLISRAATREAGRLACLSLAPEIHDLESLGRAVRSVVESGDLESLGEVRV